MADLNLESALLNKDCLILDGGLGTYLEEVGETLQAELFSFKCSAREEIHSTIL